MHRDFIELLPENTQLIEFESSENWVETGVLRMPNGWFPIHLGIPRFVWFEELENFQMKWADRLSAMGIISNALVRDQNQLIFKNHWESLHDFSKDGDTIWGVSISDRAQQFKKAFSIADPSILNNKLILDAGAGTGIVSLSLLNTSAQIVMYELTTEGLNACAAYCTKKYGAIPDNLHIVQGNVEFPPFRHGRFDYIYSDGVLHHTKNTQNALYQLIPLVSPGGHFWVWLYNLQMSKMDHISYLINLGIRRIFLNHLSPNGIKIFAHIWVVPMRIYHRLRWFVGLGNPFYLSKSWRDHILTIYDHFAVRYDHHHTPNEVISWFHQKNFDAKHSPVRSDNDCAILGSRPQK
jgi:2-polyprenyl-3-methyl-5-hydroxy-6-metoxy-1,4-benzoquinol methylase